MAKEFLYVGHYIDEQGRYILKIGTTNNLARRQAEHNRVYRRSPEYRMAESSSFSYDWYLSLSKYNTLRYEDRNRERWKQEEIGYFVRNDRFVCPTRPKKVIITIRRSYEVNLS